MFNMLIGCSKLHDIILFNTDPIAIAVSSAISGSRMSWCIERHNIMFLHLFCECFVIIDCAFVQYLVVNLRQKVLRSVDFHAS